jgi:hypothetical protein
MLLVLLHTTRKGSASNGVVPGFNLLMLFLTGFFMPCLKLEFDSRGR